MNRKQRRMQKNLPKSKPLTVVFCIPGRTFSNNFLRCWTDLLAWCLHNNIQPLLSNAYDSNVYYARQKVLAPNVKRGKYQKPFDGKLHYDYMMWIDSDMVFTPDDFVKLLNMNKEIASGIYKMSDNIHYATVENWDKDYYRKNGNFEFLNDNLLENKPSIFPVEYTGFGWVLIKKGVLESMEYPWFRPIWEDYGNNIVEFCSEDVGFCQTAITKGYKIYVNKNIVIGHEKSWIL